MLCCRRRFVLVLLSIPSLCLSGTGFEGSLHRSPIISIKNQSASLAYNLNTGRFEVRSSDLKLLDCQSLWEAVSSGQSHLKRSASVVKVKDGLGSGRMLRVRNQDEQGVQWIFDAVIYDQQPYIVLKSGVLNRSQHPTLLKSFSPLSGGFLKVKNRILQPKTLDGNSGALQSQVLETIYRRSNNNLLLTFITGSQRHSLVAGGLTYHEFCKSIQTTNTSNLDRLATLKLQGKVIEYLDCGSNQTTNQLKLVTGQPFNFADPNASQASNTVHFDTTNVVYELSQLDPQKDYTVGLSWWDYDNNGRKQSVWVESGDGKYRKQLIAPCLLPAWLQKGEPASDRVILIPKEAYQTKQCRLIIKKEAPVPNAVVSEIWIWEGKVASNPVTRPANQDVYVHLTASDPIGRLIQPGEDWIPDDRFYLDLSTTDPFESLERYGQTLKIAQGCRPNPYDFPTVCAWYAGVWQTPGAQNHPEKSRFKLATTPGLVEEAEYIKVSGFLNYSRAACRIVPDNYTEQNPQGWWDDEHWQREGFYVTPFETSQKWGDAMHQRGVMAFTYFQPSWGKNPVLSKDFRMSRPDLLLDNDVKRNLDYTKPATQAYMRRVYQSMRGWISGMMFDYCDNLWDTEASSGNFFDTSITSTAYYRLFLQLAKTGLGENSWIHERALYLPGHDIALGISDSQRTSGDTDRIDPAMVSKSGLRWYKNRAVISYDMDSKELNSSWKIIGYGGSDSDGRRMMLTMAYVAASRLLIANSFRDLSPQALYDLERTFPYPHTGPSARPIDAFSHTGWPSVYQQKINPDWSLVVLYNNELPTKEKTFNLAMASPNVDGGLGLQRQASYYIFDFWNNAFVGLVAGRANLKQTLRPGEARVLAVHRVQSVPQVLSSRRHVSQGLVDFTKQPKWDAKNQTLNGASLSTKGEPIGLWIALNGYRIVNSAGFIQKQRTSNIVYIEFASRSTGSTPWNIQFQKVRH